MDLDGNEALVKAIDVLQPALLLDRENKVRSEHSF